MTSNVVPFSLWSKRDDIDPVARSKAAHPSAQFRTPDEVQARCALLSMDHDELEAFAFMLATAQPGIVLATVRRMRGGA